MSIALLKELAKTKLHRWIRYIAIAVAITTVIYAIISSVAIERRKK